jgi:hypothetical protein
MRSDTVGKVISRLVAIYFVSIALFGVIFVPGDSMSPVLRWSHTWLRWPMAIVCVYFAIRLWRHPIDLVRSKPQPFAVRKDGQGSSNGNHG